MKYLKVLITGLFASLLIGLLPTTVSAGFSGTCTITQSPQPNFFVVTLSGVQLAQPGHEYLIGITSTESPTNPTGILVGGVGTSLFAYDNAIPATYSVTLWLVNDKTGNGHGDGSGDQFKLLGTNLCSATLP